MSESTAELRGVARGAGLVLPGVALLMLLTYGLWLSADLNFAAASPFVREWYVTLPAAVLVLVQVAGMAISLGAAREAGGRRLLLAGLALNVVAAGTALLPLVPGTPDEVSLLPLGASLLAQFPYLLFLRRAARGGDLGDIEKRAEWVAFLWAVLVCLPGLAFLGWGAVVMLAGAGGRQLRLDVLLGATVAWWLVTVFLIALPLVVLVRYGNLVVLLVQAARRRDEVDVDRARLRKAGWGDPP